MTHVLTAIAAHRAAYDAFQVAVGDDPSLEAEDAYDVASDALMATVCVSRAEAEALLMHLRWWIAEEVEFRASREPAYGIAEARVSDLAAWLEPPANAEPDPVFAALIVVGRACDDHRSALNSLDEEDEAQMRRANAAADAETAAFDSLTQITPTTLAGLLSLAEFYATEVGETERWAAGAIYLRHIARVVRGYESEGRFLGGRAEKAVSSQALACLNPKPIFALSEARP